MEGFFDFIGELIRAPFICLGWLVVGFLAGGIARYLMRSEDMPFWNDILLGFAGAWIGGLITGGLLGFDPASSGLELVLFNLILATATAMGLVFIGRRVFDTRPKRRRKKRR